MKSFFLIVLLFFSMVFANTIMAVTIHPLTTNTTVNLYAMPVGDFIVVDLKSYNSADNERLNWVQRVAIKSFQKNLAKKIGKGKMDPSVSVREVVEGSGNRLGLLSIVFAVAGVLFLFIPGWVGYLGLLLSGIGIYFGLRGLQKDEDTLLALLGTIIGALVLLLNIIVLI